MISRYFFISFFVLLFNCKNKENMPTVKLDVTTINLSYAKSTEITQYENYTLLTINSPCPKAEKTFKYALVNKNMASKITLNKDDFAAIITIPIEKMVVT